MLLTWLGIFASITWLLYSLATSSTSKIPGPWYTRLSRIFIAYQEFIGNKRFWIHQQHEKYGTVVRLAPNEVSFASPTAIKEIYMTAGGYPKTEYYSLFEQFGHRNVFTALDKKDHTLKKKRIADVYSNTNVLRSRVLVPIRNRAEAFTAVCARDGIVDVYLYLHCFALDCVTAISFHPHGTKAIEDGKDSELVQLLSFNDNLRVMALHFHYPWLGKLYELISPTSMEGSDLAKDYAWESMNMKDLSDFTLAKRLLDYPEMSLPDKVAECLDHITAGTDTTADTLCFLLWHLSQPHNSDKMQRLNQELQHVAADAQLENLPYLNAVIEEALRLWGTANLALPRRVPQGGRVIDDHFLAGGTIVETQAYTLHRLDETVFPDPMTFSPERWLEDEGSAERQHLFFAFSIGARGCIAKHLAWVEMRALLYSIYSRFRTRPADDMHAVSMEMTDQILTSRPKDMCCRLVFEPLCS